MTLEMAQSGAGVNGTWSADLEGSEFDQSGSLGGTVTGSTVVLFLNPGTPLVCGLSGALSVTGSVDEQPAHWRLRRVWMRQRGDWAN